MRKKDIPVPPNQRFKYINESYQKLSEKKKAKYSRKLEKEKKQYAKELAKYKAVCPFWIE